MVFSSVTFLFYFLPIFFILYFLLRMPGVVLLIASFIFYAWGELRNLPLLLMCIGVSYWCGISIGAAQKKGQSGLWACAVGIAINLACLAYFKYFHFAITSLKDLIKSFGYSIETGVAIVLPLGISFFTFHAISYLMDVYRKKAAPEKNIFALATYITMFPQLVAGPIVRFSSVAKQLNKRRTTLWRIEVGAKLFILGLAQKILIANTVGLPADHIFALSGDLLSTSIAWLGIVCYTLQIYFDFCGYSNMAIGLGLILGFTFPRNFNYPYVSQSITEFWRRWHISLSRWFRDYLYIPLGGNRQSSLRTASNLLLVFLLCGLWHGANWTFIVWGLYHGAFLILERVGLQQLILRLPRVLRHIYAMFFVMLGWVLFRCDSLEHARIYYKSLMNMTPAILPDMSIFLYARPSVIAAIVIGISVSTPIFRWAFKAACATIGNKYARPNLLAVSSMNCIAGAWSLLIFLLSVMQLASGSFNPFIYFRF